MSVFLNIRAKFYVDIPQYEIGNMAAATKLKITELLLRYDANLNGVVLAYKDVKPVQRSAFCYADSPYLHIPMEATFLVFRPVPGCQLPGTITYISSSAVSLCVFDYFQADVDIADLKTSWTFGNNKWFRNRENLVEGDSVVVKVINVNPIPRGIQLDVQIVEKSKAPSKPVDPEEPNLPDQE